MIALWLGLAAAVLALPRRIGARGSARPPRSLRPATRRQSGRVLPVLSAGLAAVTCVALLGLPTGPLVAGLVGPVAGWVVHVAGSRAAPMRIDRTVALTLDLTAAGLHSGRPVGDALAAAAPAAAPEVAEALLAVAGLLRLGADPMQAWDAVADGPLAPVAATATRSAESGIRLAAAFERLAAEIRADVAARAAVRAHRAGVTAMAPLAACFLPSFVCLGIVPVVVGIARGALGVVM